MMKRSAISYLDYSGDLCNFVIGCSPISAGCTHCWAKQWADTWGRDFSKVQTYPDKLQRLMKARFDTDDLKRGPGSKPLVGVCFLSDLFHPDVPADFIIDAFEVMAARRDVDWVVLTKRPERMVEVLFSAEGNYYLGGGDYCPNIILGVTAENQEMADQRIPILSDNWMGPTLVCVEPMLEKVDMTTELWLPHSIGWVIVGGESGPHRRPFDVAWAEALYQECKDAGIPFFYKQGSALRPGQDDLLGGRRVKEWPR